MRLLELAARVRPTTLVRVLHSELIERGVAVHAQFPTPARLGSGSAEPRAVALVDWERFRPPPGTLHRLVVQRAQAPAPAGAAVRVLLGVLPRGRYDTPCCASRARWRASCAVVVVVKGDLLPEEEFSVFVFLLQGPRQHCVFSRGRLSFG